jgi:hypothetical protein
MPQSRRVLNSALAIRVLDAGHQQWQMAGNLQHAFGRSLGSDTGRRNEPVIQVIGYFVCEEIRNCRRQYEVPACHRFFPRLQSRSRP